MILTATLQKVFGHFSKALIIRIAFPITRVDTGIWVIFHVYLSRNDGPTSWLLNSILIYWILIFRVFNCFHNLSQRFLLMIVDQRWPFRMGNTFFALKLCWRIHISKLNFKIFGLINLKPARTLIIWKLLHAFTLHKLGNFSNFNINLFFL